MCPAGLLSDTVYGTDAGNAADTGGGQPAFGFCGLCLFWKIYDSAVSFRSGGFRALPASGGGAAAFDDRCIQPALLFHHGISGDRLDQGSAVRLLLRGHDSGGPVSRVVENSRLLYALSLYAAGSGGGASGTGNGGRVRDVGNIWAADCLDSGVSGAACPSVRSGAQKPDDRRRMR